MAKARACKHCKTRKPAEDGIQTPVSWFCSTSCAYDYQNDVRAKQRERQLAKARQVQAKTEKDDRARLRLRKKELMTNREWQDKLQKLVNQYVVYVKDKGKPCCTCGTTASIKYDAGHYRSRGAAPELRFELLNIHKQCSVQCNQHGSGMRAEYREFIVRTYDQEALDYLDGNHPPLKAQFPHWTDYEKEIDRYRKLLRENGLNPSV
jgi:hypothetical protein